MMAYGTLLEELVKTVPDGVVSWQDLRQFAQFVARDRW